jgi:glycosyltransferase involved in cell wall biosynthesis
MSSKVIIFLATYNGQKYLSEQIDSILSQTHKNWQMIVSDDGSNDNTLKLLDEYANRLSPEQFCVVNGPRKGFASNFLSMVCQPGINGEYYAYADQDDIWVPDKLERALRWLKTIGVETPALYCSRTELVNKHGHPLQYSTLFKKQPSFSNALVQSLAGGNTMVFNHAAIRLLRIAGDKIKIITHDWWTYLLITGVGGKVYYDPIPSLKYRQHDSNLIGSNLGWSSRLNRMMGLFKGQFKVWTDLNLQALKGCESFLTSENKRLLEQFKVARQGAFIERALQMKKTGVYRQTLLGNLGLMAAIVFKKI